jgi:hypothetical protein
MRLSRALSLAADDVEVQPERLRAIAAALAPEMHGSAKPRRTVKPDADPIAIAKSAMREGETRRDINLHAVQASRSLLVRAIAMLK